jgi:hypothetical protein
LITKAAQPFLDLRFHFILSCGIMILLSGCLVNLERVAPDSATNPTFIPPTFSPTHPPPTITPTASNLQSANPNTPKCNNVLTYDTDLSIPDGTIVAPDATIDKRWRVENSGTCDWSDGYKLKLIRGDPLGTSGEQALPPTASKSKAEIRILFTAPKTPQKYNGFWQAYTPDGQPFGDAFYIDIVVKK